MSEVIGRRTVVAVNATSAEVGPFRKFVEGQGCLVSTIVLVIIDVGDFESGFGEGAAAGDL